MTNENYQARKSEYETALQSGSKLENPVVFYSIHSAGLALVLDPGKKHIEPTGTVHVIGYCVVEFTPMGIVKQDDKNGPISKFGTYATRDPREALLLLERAKVDNPDVVVSEDFSELCVSREEKNRRMDARILTTQNELLALQREAEQLRADIERQKAENAKLVSAQTAAAPATPKQPQPGDKVKAA